MTPELENLDVLLESEPQSTSKRAAIKACS